MKEKGIDIARGVAILLVILVHSAQLVAGLSESFRKIVGLGQFGVQLFFVVSAYTLCKSFENRSGERLGVLSFYIRRVFRIMPLYYVGICVYFLVRFIDVHYSSSPVFGLESYNFINLISNMLFVHGFVPSANNSIVPGGWSIGTEMAFYLIFPGLFSLVKSLLAQKSSAFYLLSVVFFVLVSLLLQKLIAKSTGLALYNNSFLYFNISNQLQVFVIGMAGYLYFKEKQGEVGNLTLLMISCVSFALLCISWYSPSKTSAALMPAFSAIFFVMMVELVSRFTVSCEMLQRVGRLSFSMYIFHFVFAWYIVPLVMGFLMLNDFPILCFITSYALVVALTFCVAVFTERWVEKWGVMTGKQIIGQLRGKRGTEISR
ncbi:acyltransferase family protein [Pseudomonas graminis]